MCGIKTSTLRANDMFDTLCLFNIAMENGSCLFIYDVLPTKNGVFQFATLNLQRVHFAVQNGPVGTSLCQPSAHVFAPMQAHEPQVDLSVAAGVQGPSSTVDLLKSSASGHKLNDTYNMYVYNIYKYIHMYV